MDLHTDNIGFAVADLEVVIEFCSELGLGRRRDDNDMLHAIRNHWRAFETDDFTVTMFIGPARNGVPLEVGVVDDEDGTAVLHAMPARPKFLQGWWKP